MNPLSEETVLFFRDARDPSLHNETRGDSTRAKVTAGIPAIDTSTKVTAEVEVTLGGAPSGGSPRLDTRGEEIISRNRRP
jgi:hypothetical protein